MIPFFLMIGFLFTLAFVLFGFKIVPEQQVWMVQRLGKFTRQLEAGLNWIVPLIDAIASKHSLKEEAIEVPEQTAITQDNRVLLKPKF
jgi:regulator of protease activity HflC (stomatin/prohibitin superfamily)